MITKLGTVITEYSVRNKSKENIPVYSVTNEQGFCTGYFSKEVASKDRTTYKIVPQGYFAYNPSRINVGSVDWQDCEERVIVSPLYVVFGVDKKLDQQYLLHYLKSDIARTYINALATGSVRDNLKFSVLQELPINLRPIDEQRKLASVLDHVDRVIGLRNEELRTLDTLVKSQFINDQSLSQKQITFVHKIINHIEQNGYMESVTILTKPPFDKPLSFTKLFDRKMQSEIMATINKVKDNAIVVVA